MIAGPGLVTTARRTWSFQAKLANLKSEFHVLMGPQGTTVQQRTDPKHDTLPELPRLQPTLAQDTTCTARQIQAKLSGPGLVAHSQEDVGSHRPASGATSIYTGSHTVTTARPGMAYCRTSPPAARRGPDTTCAAGGSRTYPSQALGSLIRRTQPGGHWITQASLRGDIHVHREPVTTARPGMAYRTSPPAARRAPRHDVHCQTDPSQALGSQTRRLQLGGSGSPTPTSGGKFMSRYTGSRSPPGARAWSNCNTRVTCQCNQAAHQIRQALPDRSEFNADPRHVACSSEDLDRTCQSPEYPSSPVVTWCNTEGPSLLP